MRQPKCKLCGSEHSSWQPHEFNGKIPKAEVVNPLRARKIAQAVTPSKECPECEELRSLVLRAREAIVALGTENTRLEGEVKVLKRQLAKAHGSI